MYILCTYLLKKTYQQYIITIIVNCQLLPVFYANLYNPFWQEVPQISWEVAASSSAVQFPLVYWFRKRRRFRKAQRKQNETRKKISFHSSWREMVVLWQGWDDAKKVLSTKKTVTFPCRQIQQTRVHHYRWTIIEKIQSDSQWDRFRKISRFAISRFGLLFGGIGNFRFRSRSGGRLGHSWEVLVPEEGGDVGAVVEFWVGRDGFGPSELEVFRCEEKWVRFGLPLDLVEIGVRLTLLFGQVNQIWKITYYIRN